MTKAEAEAIQVRRKLLRLSEPERVAQSVCEHKNQELGTSGGGYLTGNYPCTVCGEPGTTTLNHVVR